MINIITTEEQLERLLTKCISNLKIVDSSPSNENRSELIGVTEAAKYLGIAKQTLYGYTSKRLIPFIKRGGKKLLFRRSDLDKWLLEGKKDSISEITNNLNRK